MHLSALASTMGTLCFMEIQIYSPGAIVKNQAPHVNFCYSVVMGVEFQKKVGGIFSNNVQGHLEVIEGHEFRHLTDFINNAYNED